MLFGNKKDKKIDTQNAVNNIPEPPILEELRNKKDVGEKDDIQKSDKNNDDKIYDDIVDEIKNGSRDRPQSVEGEHKVQEENKKKDDVSTAHQSGVNPQLDGTKMQVIVQKVTVERFFHNGRFIKEKEVDRTDVVKEVEL